MSKKLNVYYLCNYLSGVADTHVDFVESILNFSQHRVRYLQIANGSTYFDISIPEIEKFDVILLHHNLNFYSGELCQEMARQIKSFSGLKIYFAQDEYTLPEVAAKRISDLGVHAVYGCAGSNWREIWRSEWLPNLEYRSFLPGFCPDFEESCKFLNENRKIDVVYRGSHLGHFYGKLGFEKYEIGFKFKEISKKYGLLVDIEWNRDRQIYGEKWLEFLASSKATLVTESGSSLLIQSQEQMRELIQTKKWQLEYSPEEYSEKIKILDRYLVDDGKVVIATASQKIFEAAYCRTLIVGYEGSYAGVLIPWVNFVPLKKDWSNIEEVISTIKNRALSDKIVNNAFDDLVASKKYSYSEFVKKLDSAIEEDFAKLRIKQSGKKIPIHFFNIPISPEMSLANLNKTADFLEGVKVDQIKLTTILKIFLKKAKRILKLRFVNK